MRLLHYIVEEEADWEILVTVVVAGVVGVIAVGFEEFIDIMLFLVLSTYFLFYFLDWTYFLFLLDYCLFDYCFLLTFLLGLA